MTSLTEEHKRDFLLSLGLFIDEKTSDLRVIASWKYINSSVRLSWPKYYKVVDKVNFIDSWIRMILKSV